MYIHPVQQAGRLWRLLKRRWSHRPSVSLLGLDEVVELDDGAEDIGECHNGDGLTRGVDHIGAVQSSVVAVGREVTALKETRDKEG